MNKKPLLLLALLLLFGGAVADAQTISAVQALRGLTANSSFYANTIPSMSPPRPYVEICFVNGSILSEGAKAALSPTAGGACNVGDIGWILESEDRPAEAWDTARANCLRDGMRLPEPFEFAYACSNASVLNLTLDDIIDGWEWASNQPQATRNNDESGIDRVQVPTFGNLDCRASSTILLETVTPYRCAR